MINTHEYGREMVWTTQWEIGGMVVVDAYDHYML